MKREKEELMAHPYWLTEDFLSHPLPEKEPLIEGLLFKRDLVALAGRRRHGKTTLTTNLAVALASGRKEWLGYTIPNPVRVFFFFLEDDAREIQEKLRRVTEGWEPEKRLGLVTREDLWERDIQIGIENPKFVEYVNGVLRQHEPEVVIMDNMAHLVGGDYNNPKLIHGVGRFAWELSTQYNTSIIIPAHPRKRSNNPDEARFKLKVDPEQFFEDVMGSSHFVNSFGSLWGIERDIQTDKTHFLGGAQRYSGQYGVVALQKGEDDWFQMTKDFKELEDCVLRTKEKFSLFSSMKRGEFFTRQELFDKSRMSEPTFDGWWNEMTRNGMIIGEGEDRWTRAH